MVSVENICSLSVIVIGLGPICKEFPIVMQELYQNYVNKIVKMKLSFNYKGTVLVIRS